MNRKHEEKEREQATIAKREELEHMRSTMSKGSESNNKGSEPKKSNGNVENLPVESESSPVGTKIKSRKPKTLSKLPSINRKPSSDMSQSVKAATPTMKGKTEPFPEVFVMPKIDVKYIPVEQRNSPHGIGKSFQPHEVGKTALCIQWSRTIGVQTRGYSCGVLYNLALKVCPGLAHACLFIPLNASGIKWKASVRRVPLLCPTSHCFCCFAQDYHCVVLDSCGIAYRMCQFLKSMIDQPEPAKVWTYAAWPAVVIAHVLMYRSDVGPSNYCTRTTVIGGGGGG